MCVCVCVRVCVYIYVDGLKSSYDDITSAVDFFGQVGSKHCNTNRRIELCQMWNMPKELFSPIVDQCIYK